MFDRRGRLVCLLVAFALSPWVTATADPSPAQKNEKSSSKADNSDLEADDELLEFLGSVDSEDGELMDYYSKTDGSRATNEVSQTTTRNHE